MRIALVYSDKVLIQNIQDALDFMSTITYCHNAAKIIINKENITDDFFNLKTRLAGEILQKYTNYNVQIAIIGDFSVYSSKSFRDFMYECNKGKMVFFLNDENSAVESLHNA